MDQKNVSAENGFDVIVCGGGPAGIAAAISAARSGARTAIVEPQNALGGVWTSGLLCYVLDSENKRGLLDEIRSRLRAEGSVGQSRDLFDAEAMKFVLQEMCAEAGVHILLHSKVAGTVLDNRRISKAVLECKEGRVELEARCFVDTTGDGDLAALAGCGFDLGRKEDGKTQPLSLLALIAGIPKSLREGDLQGKASASCIPKPEFLEKLKVAGFEPSYTRPSLFPLPNELCALMVDHQYECSGLKSADLTRATIQARREVHAAVAAMRKFSGEWSNVRLVATAAHIGVREGRRIHGIYRLTVDDLVRGTSQPDAVARCTFGIDIHSVKADEGGGYNKGGVDTCLPYDIPLRALIARDRDNLLMAGRCISGDFHAHSSYRVTGNAVATGEAAGTAAALAALQNTNPADLDSAAVLTALEEVRSQAGHSN